MNAAYFTAVCGLDRAAITAAPKLARPAFVAKVLTVLATAVVTGQITEFSGFTWDGGPTFSGTIKGEGQQAEEVSFDLSCPGA